MSYNIDYSGIDPKYIDSFVIN